MLQSRLHGPSLLLLTACSGEAPPEEEPASLLDHAEEVAGVYTLHAVSENPDGCEAEGPTILFALGITHLGVEGTSFFGVPFLNMVGCNGVEDCRAELDAGLNIGGTGWAMDAWDGTHSNTRGGVDMLLPALASTYAMYPALRQGFLIEPISAGTRNLCPTRSSPRDVGGGAGRRVSGGGHPHGPRERQGVGLEGETVSARATVRDAAIPEAAAPGRPEAAGRAVLVA